MVSGPQAKRWHKACLVCGGKGAKLPRPGCGKVLDSSAKLDIDGAIWCRECLVGRLLLEHFPDFTKKNKCVLPSVTFTN